MTGTRSVHADCSSHHGSCLLAAADMSCCWAVCWVTREQAPADSGVAGQHRSTLKRMSIWADLVVHAPAQSSFGSMVWSTTEYCSLCCSQASPPPTSWDSGSGSHNLHHVPSQIGSELLRSGAFCATGHLAARRQQSPSVQTHWRQAMRFPQGMHSVVPQPQA